MFTTWNESKKSFLDENGMEESFLGLHREPYHPIYSDLQSTGFSMHVCLPHDLRPGPGSVCLCSGRYRCGVIPTGTGSILRGSRSVKCSTQSRLIKLLALNSFLENV